MSKIVYYKLVIVIINISSQVEVIFNIIVKYYILLNFIIINWSLVFNLEILVIFMLLL